MANLPKKPHISALIGELHEHAISQFPQVCSKCDRFYSTFFDYAQQTVPLGLQGSLLPSDSALLALANCSCGTTLSLTCTSSVLTRRRLKEAIKADAKENEWTTEEVGSLLLEMILAHSLGQLEGC